ncbi:NAD(P)/FAD-dependent oxidoreductase [Amycolatopsis endophytica]|uniref:Cation diffusion facilitator CzcD-associated flavoprotein CzcO n=1 Tax=Amycolatopsis endophytica TaxID=860233 RepID=A0A853BED9_9PSEU|nr:NAD(P)-binding domain-containing protein [Amycolatopsis endophytica]NYI93145.1 cation diffusion facilitator CzcD-associated flavoprotein CzcO [Amycolatopsis endophytica]
MRVCIIGAGCSGFTTAKRLQDHGIPFDCFEMSDDVGGNWYFGNPNGRSACYESLHIDTSTTRLQFEEFPAGEDWPHFPHHSLIHRYFRDYVEHFGLRDKITFGTAVEHATRQPGGDWEVTLDTGQSRRYDALVVANGHHWNPHLPDYPGEFHGPVLHSHGYRSPFDPVDMRGKRIVVVGMGNSALDIASELSHRSIAEHVWVSARRGVWVLSKYRGGKPADKMMTPPWMPKKIGLALSRRAIKKTLGAMEDYGLPKPDHEPLSAHPSVSIDFLAKAGSGDLTCVPEIERLDGDAVVCVDGSRVEADVIVCATGYRMSFPFFDDPELVPDAEHRLPLFKRIIRPGIGNLYYAGLAQASPTIVNLAEQQSKLIAEHLTGRYALPTVDEMRAVITRDEDKHLGQYYRAPRHTIQVDFARYVRDLHREIEAGRKRAGAAVR